MGILRKAYHMPEALGTHVVLNVDANLYHDIFTGRSITGVLPFLNQTPVWCFSKKQDTVKIVTYGYEYVAARVFCEKLIDISTTLTYLGVPIIGRSYTFGDSQSDVTTLCT